ncbi:MAG TPA: protein kinase [Kofleriaceae bacterium]|jgi:serine/threonine protein kinase/tetratricopeptide (TPR) repeat protein|nr:protein kinase [Kofleriaceae bacterium]
MSHPVASELFAQRFLVEARIATGGMGAIFRAIDQQTGGPVALKLLQLQGSADDAQRFAREARILGELHHPHIVSYVAHGVDETNQPYLAMEWLAGESLAERICRGPLGLRDTLAVALGVSAALAEAHERGVIHRDLKPSNLFLPDRDPARIVVLDFGLARWMLDRGGVTRTGAIVGTPPYMSPEQARGACEIGPPSDIFSLGCVLYECLAGAPPFVGEYMAAVLVKVIVEEPEPIRERCPYVPEAFAGLLDRMLSKEPRRRFPRGQALHEALRRLALPSEDPADPATASVTLPLSRQEQRIISLAVAVPRRDDRERAPALAGDGDLPTALPPSVCHALLELDASIEVLPDGTVVAAMPPAASASDQAFLAVRCGLILEARLHGVEVAVATGRGHLRGQLPIGEAIDRAVELLEHFPRGRPSGAPHGVWVDALTEDLLAGRFRLEHDGGRTRAVCEQDLATGEAMRRLLGQPTPCVGRELELATLESILSTCTGDSVARAASVVASPGMGKSRLRHEFLRRTAQSHPDALVLLGRAEIGNIGAPYGVLGQAVRRLCGLVGGEPDAVRTDRLRERLGLRMAGPAAAQIAFLGELCGVRLPDPESPALQAARSDPRLMHEHVKLAFLDWLRAECQAGPVLLVLEDLHWGDALTVQLLEQALRELAELPLFVLTLARPEVRDQFPAFWASSTLQMLPLQALTRRACERLAREVLQRALAHMPDDDTVARVVAQAAGHPLYLEELIRAVAEGRCDALPETVLAMLMARLSQLDAGARQVLRAASVFGETFTRDGLAALLRDEPCTADLNTTLGMLVRAEFIEPQREGWGTSQARFKFRHALVCDAAHSLFTEGNRVVSHRLACAHLRERGGADPAVLAEHAYQGKVLDLAAQFSIEAGQRALSSFDLDAAERHARRAIECGVRGEQLGAVRAIQAWLANFRLDLLGGYTHALEALEILKPDSFWWTKTAAICFYAFFLLDRFEHAERIIRTFLESKPDPSTQLAFLESAAILACSFGTTGERHRCNQLIDRMTQVAADVDPRDRGYLMSARARRTIYLEPDPYQALEEAQQAATLFRASGNRHWVAEALFAVGMALMEMGAWTRTEEVLREAWEIARTSGDVFYAMVIHLHLGFALAYQDDAARQEEARRISDTYRDQPQLGPVVHGSANKILADVSIAAGDRETAETAVRAALGGFATLLPYRLRVVPTAVALSLERGQVAEARQLAEESLAQLEARGGLGTCEVPVRLAVAQARLADGDLEGGRSALRNALAQLQQCAGRIADAALRESYLALAPHHRVLDLARQHGILSAST